MVYKKSSVTSERKGEYLHCIYKKRAKRIRFEYYLQIHLLKMCRVMEKKTV